MTHIATIVARGLPALTVLLAGCGGGGGGGTAFPAPSPPEAPPPIVTPPPPPAPPPEPTNRAPVVAHPNQSILRVLSERAFSYDASQNGTTFSDPDGDPLTYQVRIWPSPTGIDVSGPVISGTPQEVGFIEVDILAFDSHGVTGHDSFSIVIAANAPPIVAKPNSALITMPGEHVNHDLTQDGGAFTDADGDPLTYDVRLTSPAKGLRIEGLHVVGALDSVGLVTAEITAADGYGGTATDSFSIALPAPAPDDWPNLPAASFVYDDAQLPLPFLFRLSRDARGPFWDTTPESNPTTNAGATLGRVLFYDRRVSITNTHACASCHRQEHGFAVPERFSTGALGVPMTRNAMALAQVRYNVHDLFFADRRAFTLEALVRMPIEAPIELGNPMPMLETKLAATDFYPPLFEAAFGTPEITAERISGALAQFLRAMISYGSRFDQAFHGMTALDNPNPAAVLTEQEIRGAEIFADPQALCAMCHDKSAGSHVMDSPSNNGLDAQFTDPGAGGGEFRSASLRNIAVSGPYMHDGRFQTLREVIDHYDHGVQDSPELSLLLKSLDGPKRLNLTDEDKDALEAFLHTLTDEAFLSDPKFSDPFP